MTDATAALKDITVRGLSLLVAGDMLSLQLEDFDADVIKVEPYPAGDPVRTWIDISVPRTKRSILVISPA